MTTHCRICGKELLTPTESQHCAERWPIDGTLCAGCGSAAVELELFLIRAVDQTVIGDWTAGWLKEIIKDPRRYL